MAYKIVELREGETAGFAPRGSAAALWRCKDPAVVLSGPAETGKSYSCCQKLNALMWKYPGAQAAIIRKTQKSLNSSILQTYRRVIGGEDSPVKAYGGQQPQWFDYPGGGRVWLGGMDNPAKVLSSERDFIYICQAEELTVNDWETLRTRNTGRGGVAPYAQQFADCNPGPPTHWIQQLRKSGALTFLESRHEDNPTLYDDEGVITEQGIRSIAVLDALTGLRYKRLRKGLWVAAEGLIYEGWDPHVHLCDWFEPPDEWPRIWCVDFGYTNPFVWQAWAQDPDGRLFMYREIYMTQRLVEDHAKTILDVTAGEPRPIAIICDHDAEDRATLERYLGMPTQAAFKSVSPGIQAVGSRLKIAGDKKPRIQIMRDALVEIDPALKEAHKPLCTEEEIEGYIWDPGNGRLINEKPVKDQPLKVNDHGCDALRYVVTFIDDVGQTKREWYVV